MGNWRHRPRFYYHKEKPPRQYYDPDPTPPSGFYDDGIPSWEKKFCSVIGCVPWWKVVGAKKLRDLHSNVFNWNDSASEEAFQNAKKCYWAEINGFPCDISSPSPDMYIDEINWNPDIDPELIKDLEEEPAIPNEGEEDSEEGHKSKKTRNLVSNSGDVEKNPWEGEDVTLIRRAMYQNVWPTNTSNLDSTNGQSESKPFSENEGGGWGDQGYKLWDQIGNDSGNGWGCNGDPVTDNGWGNYRSWSMKMNDGVNSQGRRFIDSGAPPRDRGWGESRGNTWGWKQQDNYAKEQKYSESRKPGGGWGAWNNGYQRKEDGHQHKTGYRNTRFQDQSWHGRDNKKRVSFGFK